MPVSVDSTHFKTSCNRIPGPWECTWTKINKQWWCQSTSCRNNWEQLDLQSVHILWKIDTQLTLWKWKGTYIFNSNTAVFGNNWHEQTKWPWENFGASPCQCHCAHLVRWNLEFATCCCYGGFGFTEISQTCLKSPLGSPGPRDWALIAAVPQHSKRTLARNQSRDAMEAKTGNVRGDAIEEVQQHTKKGDCNLTLPSCGRIWNNSLKAAALKAQLFFFVT